MSAPAEAVTRNARINPGRPMLVWSLASHTSAATMTGQPRSYYKQQCALVTAHRELAAHAQACAPVPKIKIPTRT